MNIYGRTDIGNVRSSNQDYFAIEETNGLTLAIVCDGMGGANGGSVASKNACLAFLQSTKDALSSVNDENEYESVLRNALTYANAEVFRMSESDEALKGMGTTLCAILTDGKRLWAVSVGDSRIYALTDTGLFQISHDHSYVQILIDNGSITKAEALHHPNKNIITRAVGTDEAIECDSYVMDFTARAFIICSDGLTNYVSDDELKDKILQYTHAEALTADLISLAKAGGGGDNITVVAMYR